MSSQNNSVDQLNQAQSDRTASNDARQTKKVLSKKNSLCQVQTKIRQNMGSHIIRNVSKQDMERLEQEILVYQRRWKVDPKKYPMGLRCWNVWRDKVGTKANEFPSDKHGVQSSVLTKVLEEGDPIKVAAYLVDPKSAVNKRGWCAILRFTHHQPNAPRRELVTSMVGVNSMSVLLLSDEKGVKIMTTLIEDTLIHHTEGKGLIWPRMEFYDRYKKLIDSMNKCLGGLISDIKDALKFPNNHKQNIINIAAKSEFFTNFFSPALTKFKIAEAEVLLKKLTLAVRTHSSTNPMSNYVIEARGKLYGLLQECTSISGCHGKSKYTDTIGGLLVESEMLTVSEGFKWKFECAVLDKCAKSISSYFSINPFFILNHDQLNPPDGAEIASKHANTLERLANRLGKNPTVKSALSTISHIMEKKDVTTFYRDNKFYELCFQWVEKSLKRQQWQQKQVLVEICSKDAVKEKFSMDDICDRLERQDDDSFTFFDNKDLLDDVRRLAWHLSNKKAGDYPAGEQWTQALDEKDVDRHNIEEGLAVVMKTTKKKLEEFVQELKSGKKPVSAANKELVELFKPVIEFVEVDAAVDVMLKRAKARKSKEGGKKKQKVEDDEPKINYWD